MRNMAPASWKQRSTCAVVAIGTSCAALVLGIIPAPFYAPSAQHEVIALETEQRRLAHIWPSA
jgi:hypothetical protein